MPLARTWEYGTVLAVTVVDVINAGRFQGIICQAGDEAHVILGNPTRAAKGEEGYITFKSGGPTGGYWQYTKGPPSVTPG